jgi:hypothetical protein
MHYPPQFFWNIESLWEKYYSYSPPRTDFSHLQKNFLEKKCVDDFFLAKKPDFSPSLKTVFIDEHQKEFLGLNQFSVCFEQKQKPIYFFDNHHQALIPFWHVFQYTQKPLTIVHIDAHRDDAIFPHTKNLPGLQDLAGLKTLISQCRVSDYLDAGKKIGLIQEVISITQESEFLQFPEILETKLKNKKYILNLDIDIYGPEGTAVSTEVKTKTIAKAWKNADAVCFATSPGFIDPLLAQKLGEIFY